MKKKELSQPVYPVPRKPRPVDGDKGCKNSVSSKDPGLSVGCGVYSTKVEGIDIMVPMRDGARLAVDIYWLNSISPYDPFNFFTFGGTTLSETEILI